MKSFNFTFDNFQYKNKLVSHNIPGFKRLIFTVENSPSCLKSPCLSCGELIERGNIRISVPGYFKSRYHLNCFIPKNIQYIWKSDLTINLDNSSSLIFDTWLDNFNTLVAIPNSRPSLTARRKTLQKVQMTRRRAFLEIFKFLNISDILTLSLVSKEFYQAASEDELWQTFLLRDRKIIWKEGNCKNKFIELSGLTCKICFQVLTIVKYYKCPILHKVICKECLKSEKFEIFTLRKIRHVFSINPSLLTLEYFEKKQKLMTYKYLVLEAIYRFRESQKCYILNIIKHRPECQDLKQAILRLEVEKMDYYNARTSNSCKYRINSNTLWKFGYRKSIFKFIRQGEGSFDLNQIKCSKSSDSDSEDYQSILSL